MKIDIEEAKRIIDGYADVSIVGLDDDGHMLVRIKHHLLGGKVVDLNYDFEAEKQRIILFEKEMKLRYKIADFLDEFAYLLWDRQIDGVSDEAQKFLQDFSIPKKFIKIISGLTKDHWVSKYWPSYKENTLDEIFRR